MGRPLKRLALLLQPDRAEPVALLGFPSIIALEYTLQHPTPDTSHPC